MQTSQNGSVAVLGAGAWGTALAILLANNGQEVGLWDHDSALLALLSQARCHTRYLPEVAFPKQLCIRSSLEEALNHADTLVIAVPSQAFALLLTAMQPLLRPEHRIVWATKGLERGTAALLHTVLERVLGTRYAYAVLSGPSFALEVALGLPTAVTIASQDTVFAEALRALFENASFGIQLSDDMVGVQLGAVFKNVLAVAVGLSDGVQFGANARAALMTQGLAQMMQLGRAMGARPETFMGLSGCGDVILTCTDNQSRNRRFGLALAEGLSVDQALARIGGVVEGLYNVEQLRDLAKHHGLSLPIVEQVFAVIQQQLSARDAIKALF
jgi:glycerol-3-phosphate dehydrogenase (NAD(P)+)